MIASRLAFDDAESLAASRMRSQLVWVREGFARGPMRCKLRTRRGAVRGWLQILGEKARWRIARNDADMSAERSEAREDGVGPNATFRVASPLVMATRGSCVRGNEGGFACRGCT